MITLFFDEHKPPATIEFARTWPPFTVSVPAVAPVPPFVRARRIVVFTESTAPVLTMPLVKFVVTIPLLFTSMVPVVAPFGPVAT